MGHRRWPDAIAGSNERVGLLCAERLAAAFWTGHRKAGGPGGDRVAIRVERVFREGGGEPMAGGNRGPRYCAAALISCCAAAFAIGGLQFTDATVALRVDFTCENSPTRNKYLPETMGGGVA